MDWDSSGSIVEISKAAPPNAAVSHTGSGARRIARHTFVMACALMVLVLIPLSGCDTESLLSSPDSDAELALRILDGEAMMIGHVDIKSGLSFVQSFVPEADMDNLNSDENYLEFKAKTGIDLMTDVKSAYFALSQSGDGANGAMLMFMDFDQSSLVQLMEEQADMTRLNSTDFTDAFQSPNSEIMVGIHDGSMMVLASSEDELARMSDRMSDGTLSTLPSDLLQKVSRNQHWAIIRNVDQVLAQGLDLGNNLGSELGQLGQIAGTIGEIGISASFTSTDIFSSMFIRPTDNISPADLESLIKGLRAAARIQFQEVPDLLEMAERLDVSSDARFVEISVEVSMQELRDLGEEYSDQIESALSKRTLEKNQD